MRETRFDLTPEDDGYLIRLDDLTASRDDGNVYYTLVLRGRRCADHVPYATFARWIENGYIREA